MDKGRFQMSADTKKDELIRDLLDARQSVLAAVKHLPADLHDTAFLGTWDPKDLLAHLVGWDEANLEAVRDILDGQLPAIYKYPDADWQAFNEELVARHRRDDLAELFVDAARSHLALIDFLRGLPPEEFERDRGLRDGRFPVTLAGLLEVEAREERVHARQVREFARHG